MAKAEHKVPHVVVVGGGFGGLLAAKKLGALDVSVTLLDRRNHHLFQPLLYQVAMAGLSPADIASPIRSILRDQKNVRVLLAEVQSIDTKSKRVLLADGELSYDILIVATGMQNNYFGHDEWAEHAPGLKCIEDALEIRRRILLAFERAERTNDEALRQRLLTFVVIGAGPTGVEMAGALAELAHTVLASEFRAIDPKATRIVLVEGAPRVLSTFHESLSKRALEQLADLQVEVRTDARVLNIDAQGVSTSSGFIDAATVVWAAGVKATPLLATLDVPLDRAGRVLVNKDLSIPGHPEVFVIGDAAAFVDEQGKTLPGTSPVALQQALCVVANLQRSFAGQPRQGFRFFDKGAMATIGRSRAIAESGSLRLSGYIAWIMWGVVHVWYLIGFRNRLSVMLNWIWSYLTYRRGARLITAESAGQRPPGVGDVATAKP